MLVGLDQVERTRQRSSDPDLIVHSNGNAGSQLIPGAHLTLGEKERSRKWMTATGRRLEEFEVHDPSPVPVQQPVDKADLLNVV